MATYHRNKDSLSALQALYPRLSICHLDQGDLDSVESFTEAVRLWLQAGETNGTGSRLHILINNAALGSATVVQYLDLKLQGQPCTPARRRAMEDDALMRVNALGPLWVTEAMEPFLVGSGTSSSSSSTSGTQRRNYSTVVFMGSVGGSIGVFPEYRVSDLMSKAAVAYLAKQLAAQHINSAVDVLCIAPGATNTEMFQRSTLDTLADPAAFVRQMPKQRLLEPEEIAAAVYAMTTERWARAFHGGVLDASLGLGVRPGVQTETETERRMMAAASVAAATTPTTERRISNEGSRDNAEDVPA
jgi:NAD(P)-dependent dehydrogenase (short-subunit alcohol dehydrogenase family)